MSGTNGQAGGLSGYGGGVSTSAEPAVTELRKALNYLTGGGNQPDDDEIFAEFMDWVSGTGVTPYPHQEESVLEISTGANVVLATPTGSGKTLVALGAHFVAAATGRRSIYTAPIKALVSEKFFSLCDIFGADMVGMATGDATVNGDAPIICCTAEVLANQALRRGSSADVGLVIMDEFHYYGDPQRGWAWQVPLIELPQTQFVLLSATLGDTQKLRDDLSERTGRSTVLIDQAERPVPLHHTYSTTPIGERISELIEDRDTPVYVVHFTQAAAIERASGLMSLNVCTKEEKKAITEAMGHFRFTSSFGKQLSRFLKHGIGVHHAGMLPKYRRLVEQLAQLGVLKVICGTDTLGVGINVPIRTVLLTGLTKYDGRKTRVLQAREFHQIAGRAGRAGFDTIGNVVVQAPEHTIENLKAIAKAEANPKKKSKPQRKKAPEGFVNWSDKTHERIISAAPESLTPRMQVTHSMILNVVARPGNAFEAMHHLLRANHAPRKRQNKLIIEAIRSYRALVEAELLERLPEPDSEGRVVRLRQEIPENFALNQPLSTFAVVAVELLDPEDDDYALNVLTVFESTLDSPRPVLHAQEKKARGVAVAEMKADGVEYEERMRVLDEITYPQPLRELIESAYETYSAGQPWVRDHELQTKSVVRDMWERAMTFGEFVAFYQLSRSEGVLLRYLADAYRALRTSVPAEAQTEDLTLIVEWLGEMIRQVDSSLLDEWEDMANGTAGGGQEVSPAEVTGPRQLTDNVAAFTVMVRNAMYRRVELFSREDAAALGDLDGDSGFDQDRWEDLLDDYFDDYSDIDMGPDARGPKLLSIKKNDGEWLVRQTILDPEGNADWGIEATVNLEESNMEGAPVVTLTYVGTIGDRPS